MFLIPVFRALPGGIRSCAAAVLLAFSLGAPQAEAAPEAAYALAAPIPLGAATRWDYAAVDPVSGRVFVTLGDHVSVVDPASGKVLGRIGGVEGAHGVVFAPERKLGFISSGKTDSIVTFDLDTLKVLRTTPAGGHNPDALLYLPESGRLYSFNGKSQDMTVIDPQDGKVLATVKLAGKPEFAAGDADRIFLNLEDIHQLVVIDVHTLGILRSTDLSGCEEPTGLDYDRAHGRIFSVCANGHLMVTSAADGARVADLPIGEGPDAVVFDPRRSLLLAPGGASGTLTVLQQLDADHYRVRQSLNTRVKARTLAYDATSGKVFLPVPGEAGQFDLLVVTPPAP